jgi:hypothetical protein
MTFMNKKGESEEGGGTFWTIGNVILVIAVLLALLVVIYFAGKALFGIDIKTMLPG